MEYAAQDVAVVGLMTTVGAGLGAGIARWWRGPGHALRGAVIGGIAAYIALLVAEI